jgi:hypothetical protein
VSQRGQGKQSRFARGAGKTLPRGNVFRNERRMWSAAIIRCAGAARHPTRHPVELGGQEFEAAFGAERREVFLRAGVEEGLVLLL